MSSNSDAGHEHAKPPPRRPPRRPTAPKRAVARQPAVAPDREPLPGQLPDLQRSIGNAAVGMLVQRSRADAMAVQREEEEHITLEVAPGGGAPAKEQEEVATVQRKPEAGAPAMLVQRFTEVDVQHRAKDLWERKGSPPNQSKQEQDKDYFEARRQLEVEERSHGIWEEKGKPQNQSEAERKKDYSEAETQIQAVKDLDAAANAAAVKAKLLALQQAGTEWRVLRYVFKSVKASVRDLVRGDSSTKTLAFALAAAPADKAELIYFLKGDRAWKRQAMADNGVDQNTFREALVRLGVFEKGTAAHKTGPEVDKLIGEHLKQYVERGLEARGKVAGRVAVVDWANWDVIGKAEFGSEWNEERKSLNAFVDRSSDPPRVFIHKDRGNAGTAIHEGVHFWGSPARPINAESHDLNEGVTEYFARKVCNALDPKIPRAVYGKQFAIASKMIAVVGEDVVSSAYFDGNLGALKAAFRTDQRWNKFCEFVEADKLAQAEAVLDRLKSKADFDKAGDFEVGDLFSTIA